MLEVRSLFEMARESKPAIIFVDEVGQLVALLGPCGLCLIPMHF